MKKIFAIILTLVALLSLFGCAKQEESEKDEGPKQTVYLPASYKYHAGNDKGTEISFERHYTYDDKGRCIGCTETGVSEQGYTYENALTLTYDEEGNLISEKEHRKTLRDDEVVESTREYTYEYTYDKKGRATKLVETYISDGESKSETEYTLEYDTYGNLIMATYGDYIQYYKYDNRDRLIEEIYQKAYYISEYQMAYQYNRATYSYDKAGNVTGVVYTTARTSEPVGREELDTLEFEAPDYMGFDKTFYYDEEGRLSGIDEPDEYEYDEKGHLVREEVYTTVKYRGKWVERLISRYTCDENGNVILFEAHNRTEEFTYVEVELSKSNAEFAQRQFSVPLHLLGCYGLGEATPILQQQLNGMVASRYHYFAYYRLIPNPIW